MPHLVALDGSRQAVSWSFGRTGFRGWLVCRSGRGREVRVEFPADRHRLLAGKAAIGGEIGDRLEVVVLSTRQTPVEHARDGVADVLEAVHDVARDEGDGAGADRRGL